MEDSFELDMARDLDNPMWDIVKDIPGSPLTSVGRWEPDDFPMSALNMSREERDKQPSRYKLCGEYAFAIPSPDAIAYIVSTLKPRRQVIEIGAGTGYWAWMLSQCGIDVNCYDHKPPHGARNHYFCKDPNTRAWVTGEEYSAIMHGGPEVLDWASNRERVLFLCWPDYDTEFGADTVDAYDGDMIIYIGEMEGGCCGNDRMFKLLFDEFEAEYSSDLVSWWGIHDELVIFRRKDNGRDSGGN